MLTPVRTLDYVILLCEDIARMKAFYHETLGFPIERDWDDWIEMRVGAVLLTLRKRGRPYDGEKSLHSAGVQLAFRVAPREVDQCYAELLHMQVEILEPPRDHARLLQACDALAHGRRREVHAAGELGPGQLRIACELGDDRAVQVVEKAVHAVELRSEGHRAATPS